MPYVATSLSKIVYYFTKPKKYFSYFLGKGAGPPATQISFEKNLSSVLDKNILSRKFEKEQRRIYELCHNQK